MTAIIVCFAHPGHAGRGLVVSGEQITAAAAQGPFRRFLTGRDPHRSRRGIHQRCHQLL